MVIGRGFAWGFNLVRSDAAWYATEVGGRELLIHARAEQAGLDRLARTVPVCTQKYRSHKRSLPCTQDDTSAANSGAITAIEDDEAGPDSDHVQDGFVLRCIERHAEGRQRG